MPSAAARQRTPKGRLSPVAGSIRSPASAASGRETATGMRGSGAASALASGVNAAGRLPICGGPVSLEASGPAGSEGAFVGPAGGGAGGSAWWMGNGKVMVRFPDGNSSIRNQGVLTNWLASVPLGRIVITAAPARSHRIPVLLDECAQRAFGPRPQMLDDFGGAERADPPRRGQVKPAGKPEQEPGREQIAGAGGVDEAANGGGRNRVGFLAADDQATFFAAGHDAHPRVLAERRNRAVKICGLVEALDLRLVGEGQVDGAVANEIEEFATKAVDAEGIRQTQRHQATGLVREGCGLEKR